MSEKKAKKETEQRSKRPPEDVEQKRLVQENSASQHFITCYGMCCAHYPGETWSLPTHERLRFSTNGAPFTRLMLGHMNISRLAWNLLEPVYVDYLLFILASLVSESSDNSSTPKVE